MQLALYALLVLTSYGLEAARAENSTSTTSTTATPTTPETISTTPLTLSTSSDTEFTAADTFDCKPGSWPLETRKVSGGYDAYQGQFPSFVSVTVFSGGKRFINCGGTILSGRHVLTAAHCVASDGNRPMKEIAIFVRPTHKWNSVAEIKRAHKVAKVCVSDGFTRVTQSRLISDVAILKLERTISFSEYTSSACMPTAQPKPAQRTYSVGLGAVGFDDFDLPILPQLLQVLPTKVSSCSPNDTHWSTLCSSPYQPEHLGDTCVGDSGSGVFALDKSGSNFRQTLLGITSYGPSRCEAGVAGKSVNANIFALKPTIKKLLKSCA